MSSKKSDWTDGLTGESSLPADEFTWTDASNYGLDGFGFDQTMNEGVLNRPGLPGATPGPAREGDDQALENVMGMGGLPDELFSGGADVSFVDSDPLYIVEDGINLSRMLEDSEVPMTVAQRKAASLADLAWLDPTQTQDPERLPKELLPDRPPLNSIPELEEAWGVDRRTNGIQRVPSEELDAARYTESIKSPPPAVPGARASADVFRKAVLLASRRSHYGHSLRVIAQGLVDTLGNDSRLPSVMERLAADHGLVGTVFVRAASFPGLKNGKYANKLKKLARNAKYVLGNDATCAQKLGKVLVANVPWEKALAHYAPTLTAEGYKVASGASPKETLRRAFLGGPVAQETAIAHHLPKYTAAADRVSAQDAFKALAADGVRELVVLESLERRAMAAKRASLNTEIHKWAKAGKLTPDEALRLARSPAAVPVIRQVMATLINAVEASDYEGSGLGMSEHREAAFKSLAEKEATLEFGERKKVANYLVKQVAAGLLTKREAGRIMAIQKPSHELLRIATMAVQTAAMHRRIEFKVEDAKEYEGPVVKAASQQTVEGPTLNAEQKMVMAASTASGIRAPEFTNLLRWSRQAMSEGVMGRDLSQLMVARWSPTILKAASGMLRQLRAEHEGLAGNLYVDAAAYATEGIKGCEAGALKHRSNQVRTVMAMSKCAGCVHAANGVCNIYSKPLIHSASDVVSDAKALQKKALYMADASDAEVTASLFAPSEFSLQSPMEGDLGLGTALETESLGDILFGDGVILED